MNDFLKDIMASFILILILFITFVTTSSTTYETYEYVDLSNNKGYAQNCSYQSYTIINTIQGNMICKLEDGTVISVKQYKLIKTEEVRLIEKLRWW